MEKREKISDFNHPEIKKTAHGLVSGKHTPKEKVESTFYFVWDEIKFGLPSVWDEVRLLKP